MTIIGAMPGMTRLYSPSMKTAISVPDETFARVEATRQQMGLSRSEFYATAARRWLDEREGAEITAQIDAALAAAGSDIHENDEFLREAARRQAEADPW
jgi:metal-responsive CopG/Arc/MetJ family transcriptional regulator